MKRQVTLFVGNDINNLVPGHSWKDLLKDLQKYCGIEGVDTEDNTKPFPLLYEEIYLRTLAAGTRTERDMKLFISQKYRQTKPGAIHKEIMALTVENIITTNYDFNIEGALQDENEGIIKETLYSIFRHSVVNGKNIWHAHGDCHTHLSINLGYEHYSGQLQQLRNYVVTGTDYQNKKLPKTALIKRLQHKPIGLYSWADLFFRDDIYIFGLRLDFVESDIWWLLNYRARQILTNHISPGNKIYYFIPSDYVKYAKAKLDLLNVNTVEIIDQYQSKPKDAYYQSVLQHIRSKL